MESTHSLPLDTYTAAALLEWQLEMGADEPMLDAPLNRYDLPERAEPLPRAGGNAASGAQTSGGRLEAVNRAWTEARSMLRARAAPPRRKSTAPRKAQIRSRPPSPPPRKRPRWTACARSWASSSIASRKKRRAEFPVWRGESSSTRSDPDRCALARGRCRGGADDRPEWRAVREDVRRNRPDARPDGCHAQPVSCAGSAVAPPRGS